jgi:hypothetical protein
MLGAAGTAATAAERVPPRDGMVLAADDSAQGSGQMGEDSGAQSGDEAAPEGNSQNTDQPAQRNPTAGGEDDQGEDDVMPPSEDEDVPPEDGENPE